MVKASKNGNGIPYDEPQATPAAQWPRQRYDGIVVKLPSSGLLARLRPVTTELFIRMGKVPDQLTRKIVEITDEGALERFLKSKAAEDGKLPLTYGRRDGESETDYERNMRAEAVQFNDYVVIAAFVEPRVVLEKPGEGEINIAQLDSTDRNFVVGLYDAPVSRLESFRYQQSADVELVQSGESDGIAS